MNNSIGFSQDSYGNSVETDAGEQGVSKEGELGVHDDLANSSAYTFHRHSAPKNVIYFRCSDKRCPARLHFNTDSKSFIMKNHHLDPSIHKPPVMQKAIKASEFISNPNSSIRGSIILDSDSIQLTDASDPNSRMPQKRSKDHIILDPMADQHYMLRFKPDSSEKFPEFRSVLIEKCLASKVLSFSAGKKFTNERCEEKSDFAIEVYTVSHFIVKVLIHVNHYFGRGVGVLFYTLD